MIEKPPLFWVSDSGGLNTCHVNGEGLSYKKSMIGWLQQPGTVGGPWVVKTTNGQSLGEYPTLARARKALEETYLKVTRKAGK